jgi:hypothetical protein
LDEARIVFGGASARQDAIERIAAFEKDAPIQLEGIVKKANPKTFRLPVIAKNSTNACQGVTIQVVDRENAG